MGIRERLLDSVAQRQEMADEAALAKEQAEQQTRASTLARNIVELSDDLRDGNFVDFVRVPLLPVQQYRLKQLFELPATYDASSINLTVRKHPFNDYTHWKLVDPLDGVNTLEMAEFIAVSRPDSSIFYEMKGMIDPETMLSSKGEMGFAPVQLGSEDYVAIQALASVYLPGLDSRLREQETE